LPLNVVKQPFGGLAQLVERCDRTAEARDSSSLSSIPRNLLSVRLVQRINTNNKHCLSQYCGHVQDRDHNAAINMPYGNPLVK
jgi:hypothetical protein